MRDIGGRQPWGILPAEGGTGPKRHQHLHLTPRRGVRCASVSRLNLEIINLPIYNPLPVANNVRRTPGLKEFPHNLRRADLCHSLPISCNVPVGYVEPCPLLVVGLFQDHDDLLSEKFAFEMLKEYIGPSRLVRCLNVGV